jgi:hypothetical protein
VVEESKDHEAMLSQSLFKPIQPERARPENSRLVTGFLSTMKTYSSGHACFRYGTALAQTPEDLRMTQRRAEPTATQHYHCRQYSKILIALCVSADAGSKIGRRDQQSHRAQRLHHE